MSKSTKNKYDRLKTEAADIVSLAYGVTRNYVLMCANGRVQYGRFQEIRIAFNTKYNELLSARKNNSFIH